MDNKEDSRSSTETSTMDEEKQILLESSEVLEQTTLRPKHSPFITTRVAILLLVLSNIAFVTALDLVLRSQSSSSLPAWMPPERTAKKLFMYQSVFGGEPDAKSEEMWTKLIPIHDKIRILRRARWQVEHGKHYASLPLLGLSAAVNHVFRRYYLGMGTT
ncbi:hypothetical protein COL154_011856 [Colletotrichum chrysophilum]|uniref:uncharacterized protein n=1 Tax=Colletotrichum chrysophilum TaxID=1836956 RepID=UPI0022FFE83F|nr:uncharacterized protein COL26b_012195 [Colletotrichum chrysophilum]KAJ0338087.1 hypothetical protein KNSL1_012595 [Colletotrichum chrysophilum]KAJ0354204.1 hypothetical protein COL154_011856 [Colletotrichum chrysophilum]KAJ0365204.1 hypothetical protein COL26b_012195 [Colletotrichum chrysophilum]